MTSERRTAVGLVALSAIIVILIVIACSASSGRRTFDTRVTRTYQVLRRIDALQMRLSALESEQRMQVLTGQDPPSGSLADAAASLPAGVEELARLTADTPTQQPHIARLRDHLSRRLTLCGELTALIHEGRQRDARRLLLSRRGSLASTGVTDVLGIMRAQETGLLRTSIALWDRYSQVTNSALILLSIASLGLLGAVGRELERERRRRREMARIRREAHRQVSTILESITDGFFAVDESWRFTYVNRSPTTIASGLGPEDLGHRLWDVAAGLIGQEFEYQYRRAMVERRHTHFEAFYAEVGRWYEVNVYPTDQGLSVYFRDVTERKEMESELQRRAEELAEANARLAALATTDALTGLANRRVFEERLDQEHKRSARYGEPFSVVMVDVDDFKGYNDAFGHPAGDEALRQVAALLLSGLRETDLVARYGGEELVILLPNTTVEEATEVAERARRTVGEAAWPHRPITVSMGAATAAAVSDRPWELIEHADQALYASKAAGRNRVTHYASLQTAAVAARITQPAA